MMPYLWYNLNVYVHKNYSEWSGDRLLAHCSDTCASGKSLCALCLVSDGACAGGEERAESTFWLQAYGFVVKKYLWEANSREWDKGVLWT